jgi:hypothetical protein
VRIHAPKEPQANCQSSLEQLARVGGWRCADTVLLMWNYLDESGEFDEQASPQRLARLTLGGFFAPWEHIEQLCGKWRAALNEECLAEFHMKEIASDEHRYSEWPLERQHRLNRFVGILCDHAHTFCAYTYNVITPGKAFEEAYEIALNRAMIRAATISDESRSRAHIVFAKTQEVSGELIGRYFDRLNWGEYHEGYHVLRSRDEPALQAAEIVARGMKRLMQDGLITHSFRRVLTAGKPFECWPPDPVASIGARGISPQLARPQMREGER